MKKKYIVLLGMLIAMLVSVSILILTPYSKTMILKNVKKRIGIDFSPKKHDVVNFGYWKLTDLYVIKVKIDKTELSDMEEKLIESSYLFNIKGIEALDKVIFDNLNSEFSWWGFSEESIVFVGKSTKSNNRKSRENISKFAVIVVEDNISFLYLTC